MSTLELAKVGNMHQLLVSYGAFPAKFFSMGKSWEDIQNLLAEGVQPPAWGTWDTCEVGNLLQVRVTSKNGISLGPEDGVHIGMWGLSAVSY